MRPVDLLIEACGAIRRDRRQAILCLAGIVAGVAVVIAAIAIGDGAAREALESVESMGLDNVILRSERQPLTVQDASLMANGVPHAGAVACVRSARLAVETRRRRISAAVLGVTSAWPAVTSARLRSGRWFGADELRDRRRVAIVGAPVAKRLFDGNPIGELVRIGPDWFRVVGVMDAAETLVVPLGALDVRLTPADRLDRVTEIIVHARRAPDVMTTAREIQAVATRRGLGDSVQMIVPRELAAARLRARRAFDLSLQAIGGLVLALGGLGITNVTLAGVARRMAEIGVRRAVGARRRDIVRQIAAECTALSVAGGLAGLPLGCAVTFAVGYLAGWRTSLTWTAPAVALTLAAAVGLASGVYPARVAASWTPCEALRHE